jgi:hypothetical protein
VLDVIKRRRVYSKNKKPLKSNSIIVSINGDNYNISTYSFNFQKDLKCIKNSKEIIKTNTEDLIFISSLACDISQSLNLSGDYFAFMLTYHNDVIIGFSENPIYSAYVYNNFKSKKEKEKMYGKKWQISIVIGPFINKQECYLCCTDWCLNTRGIESKRNSANYLATMYNKNLYSSDLIPLDHESLKCCLKRILPQSYSDAYKKLTCVENKIK